ncbi:unnamed protein product [Rotaria sordida]|uniref:F-box domain-containing protein n=1 Tax=Rotaria sordida TaxID=392033 RepID=A0A814HGL1_9BILA|nr:unnamed protein product [Rotaria sordida]CAF1167391.1 unnamed protein product [Rotaria sordida]
MIGVSSLFINKDNLNQEKFENENDEQKLSRPFIDPSITSIILFSGQGTPFVIKNCVVTVDFSIGEITALLYASCMTYKDGLRLIKTHAKSMQPSSNEVNSGMISVFVDHKIKLSLQRQCFGINDSNNDHEDGNTLNCNVYHLVRRLKTLKPNISIFEFLPNELILNLFEYLYCDDIIYAFNNLNYRFQLLLHSYEYYHLNFDKIIMKSKFNLIENLPLNIQHVKSLTLSNNVYSCTNIEQCLLKYPIELFYIRLQSLSFIPKDTDQLLYLILLLPNFQQLKYLLISENKFYYKSDYDTKNKIRNIILFEIKTLKYFTWDGSGYEFIE